MSVFVPDNTTLIGLGNVVLNFLPEQNEVNDVSAYLLSPINVRGNIHMKNIKINCKNCRYGIHDETSGIAKYDNGEHIYENIEIHYLKSKEILELSKQTMSEDDFIELILIYVLETLS